MSMDKIREVLTRNPVYLINVVKAFFALAIAFGMIISADQQNAVINFITGPSRTGDIERILVLGAHGPKKLTVLLVP